MKLLLISLAILLAKILPMHGCASTEAERDKQVNDFKKKMPIIVDNEAFTYDHYTGVEGIEFWCWSYLGN